MILGIDPGNTESAYTLIDQNTLRPVAADKVPNERLLLWLSGNAPAITHVGIEMIASYGMPVGREVFETCLWIGRFAQHLSALRGRSSQLVYRKDVKLHHCHDSRAKDSNIAQALVDRFAFGVPNRGKGTKADPGWFYGFHSDIWAAYAVTVYVADGLLLNAVSASPSPKGPSDADTAPTGQGVLL